MEETPNADQLIAWLDSYVDFYKDRAVKDREDHATDTEMTARERDDLVHMLITVANHLRLHNKLNG